MIYLVLAILLSSSINIGLTFSKHMGCEELNVTFFNYVMAGGMAFLMMMQQKSIFTAFSLTALIDSMKGNPSAQGSMTFAVFFGAVTGFVYLAGLLLTQRSIQKNGPSPTTMFARIGIVIPLLVAILLWREFPELIQWVGIVVAFAALILYNYNGRFRMDGLLFLIFLLSGLGELTNKLFTEWCLQEYKPVFLFAIFGTCLLLSAVLLMTAKKRNKIKSGDVWIGLTVGIANLSSTFFIVKSLSVLPATLVYPILCAGVILTIAVVSRICFKEKLSKRGYTAVGLTIVSLILMNL